MTGSVLGATAIAVVSSTVDVSLVHLALGGYANSGAALMWSTILLLSAVLVVGRGFSLGLGAFYLFLALVLSFLEQNLQASRTPPDPTLPAILFVTVLAGNVILILLILSILLRRLGEERERSESLLLNVLPADVAAELKEHGHYPARRFDAASVLFADVADFTPLAASTEPEETVAQLNDVFTHFDALADRHGVEKIRTIGDAYVAVAGVPIPKDDHAEALSRNGFGHPQVCRIKSLVLSYRNQLGTGSGGSNRETKVPIRHVGRHREHGFQDGVFWRARPCPDQRLHIPAHQTQLHHHTERSYRGQGQRNSYYLVA